MKKSLSLLFFFAFVSLFTASTFAAVTPISSPKPVNIKKSIPVSIKLITPTNFENLNEDSQYTIKWESKNVPADAKIILDIFNGGKDITSPNTQIAILSATTTSYTWTVKGNNGWGVGMVTSFERVAKLFGIESAYAGASNYTIGIRVVSDTKGQLAFDTSKPFFINPAITIPTAKFTTDPTLKLSFDAKKKTPMIEGSAVVEISSPSNSDTKIYTIAARIIDKNGNQSYTNAANGMFEVISGATKEIVDQSPDYSGNTVYKIKAGEKAKFKVTITDNPEFMFGGVYKMSIQNISFVKPNLNGGYDYDFTTIVPPSKTSNALAIVGEKGPYISSTNSPVATDKDVVIKGDRFGKKKSDNIIYISGVNKGGLVSKDGKTIVIPRDWFTGAYGKTNGMAYDNIQIENPKFGKSNIVFVEVKGVTSLTPQIDAVSSPAAGNFEIDSEGKVFITGTNLIYKDSAEVFIGDQKATITQYGNDLMIVTAPKLALGSYDMYLTTGIGKSNIVKVKVITSTTGIDLTSTCPTTKFDRDLVLGSSGNDVVALQTFLYAKGFSGTSGVATGYFGALTKSSLTAYQVSKGIMPSDGSFGPITRAAMTADCTPAPITVISPNESLIYAIDGSSTINIRWSLSYGVSSDTVKIDLYKGGVFVKQIAANQPILNFLYEWSPSIDIVSGMDYKIRISREGAANSVYDESDNFFGIASIGLSVSNLSASYSLTTGGSNGDTTGASVTFTFTATNTGNSDVYISKVPSVALATSTTGSVGSPAVASSTITYVTSNPSTFAADTGTAPTSGAYVILAGASRTLTYSGSLDNTNGVSGIRVFKISAINYGTSTANTVSSSITSGLDTLTVTPSLSSGISVVPTTTPTLVQTTNATSTMISITGTSTPFLTPISFVSSVPTINFGLNNNQVISPLATSSIMVNPISLSSSGITNTSMATTSLIRPIQQSIFTTPKIPVWGTN